MEISNVVIVFKVVLLVDFYRYCTMLKGNFDFLPITITFCGGRKREFQRDKCQICSSRKWPRSTFQNIFSNILALAKFMPKRYFIGSAAHISPQTEPTERQPKKPTTISYFIKLVSSKKGLGLKLCNSSFLTFAYFAEYYKDASVFEIFVAQGQWHFNQIVLHLVSKTSISEFSSIFSLENCS